MKKKKASSPLPDKASVSSSVVARFLFLVDDVHRPTPSLPMHTQAVHYDRKDSTFAGRSRIAVLLMLNTNVSIALFSISVQTPLHPARWQRATLYRGCRRSRARGNMQSPSRNASSMICSVSRGLLPCVQNTRSKPSSWAAGACSPALSRASAHSPSFFFFFLKKKHPSYQREITATACAQRPQPDSTNKVRYGTV